MRISFEVDRPLVTAEAVKRRLMEMSREQGMTKSTATIYKVRGGGRKTGSRRRVIYLHSSRRFFLSVLCSKDFHPTLRPRHTKRPTPFFFFRKL